MRSCDTMEDVEDLLQNADFHNWFRVRLAMKKVAVAIKEKMVSDFKRFYGKLSTDFKNMPQCHELAGSSISCMENKPRRNWCTPCDSRARKLEINMRKSVANWEKKCKLSVISPESEHELLYIFLRIATGCDHDRQYDIMLNDLSCLCKVLSVCRYYHQDSIGELKMSSMNELRLKWAHDMNEFKKPWQMTEHNKRNSFKIMNDVFDAQFMQPIAAKYRAILMDIEHFDVGKAILKAGICNVSLQLDTFNDTIKHVRACQNNVSDSAKILLTEMRELANETRNHVASNEELVRQISEDVKGISNKVIKLASALPYAIIGTVLLVCLVLVGCYFIWPAPAARAFWAVKPSLFPLQGCPDEVNQNMTFHLNFQSHGDFHLREWLYEEVTNSISEQTTLATLLLADEGYGLSYITKQMICATEKEGTAYRLRRQLLAYHICKFNYRKRQSPEDMIRNFIAMMSRQLLEFGQYVDENSAEIERALDRCGDDIYTCFKDVIQTPLTSISHHDQMIIVIDALDECGMWPHSVLRLLQWVLTDDDLKLPVWIKFVLTSKYHTEVTHDLIRPDIKLIKLDDFDPRHLALLELFVWKNSGFPLSRDCVKEIVSAADGSFLCLKDDMIHLLSNCKRRGYERYTSCLDRKFEDMFSRAFETIPDFERIRPLLEVVVASFNPLHKSVYVEIAEKLGIDVIYKLPKAFKRMDYFLRISSVGNVFLRHQSMKHWLTSEKQQGRPYYVSEKNGHILISQHYLKDKLTVHQNQIKPVDLARHVILSGDKKLISLFRMQYQTQLKHDYKSHWEEILNGNFHRANSEVLVTLLLLNSQSVSLDRLAFNASVTNESDVLYTLLKLGASSRYTSDIPEVFVRYKNCTRVVKIDDGEWNMLQIAARYGLISVIDVLMKHDEYLVYKKHEIEGNAFQIALKYQGEKVIRKMLLLNRNLSSIDSMIFAASEGYSNAIRILLEYGGPNQCVECNKTIIWLDKDRFHLTDTSNSYYRAANSDREFSLFRIISDENERELFIREIGRDIWILSCNTPLDVAMIYGHFNVFKLLLDNNPGLIQCRHYRGFTPIITAIRYNRLKMFSYLLDLAGAVSGTCKTFNYRSRNQLLRVVCSSKRKKLCEQQGILLPEWLDFCPNGTTIEGELGHFSYRGAMSDVYHRWKDGSVVSSYMYFAVCKESTFETLFEIAGCPSIRPYDQTSEIRFDDYDVCNVEQFTIKPTDVSCKAMGKKAVVIYITEPEVQRLLEFHGLDKYTVVSTKQNYRKADFPSHVRLLRSMHDYNRDIPRACFCNKFHQMANEDAPNATEDLTHLYSWTVEGMTFLKFPRLFVLCQQHYILKQVTRDNPWRTEVQSCLNTDVVQTKPLKEIELLEMPES